MENKELTLLNKALEKNFECSFDATYDPIDNPQERTQKQNTLAIVATIVDYLNGDIEGLEPPIANPMQANHPDASLPNPPEPPDNGDPDALATSVCKTLGSLGLSNLADLKGYRVDENNHILLYINGRMADSGWTEIRPLSVLSRIMREHGLPFTVVK